MTRKGIVAVLFLVAFVILAVGRLFSFGNP